MFTPKYPVSDTLTALRNATRPSQAAPVSAEHHDPAPVPPTRPAINLTPGSTLALVGGGTAVVLIVGAVLVSMLLAVAITGASVAVCAVVVRSLMNHNH
ncbi:hypothetical protein K7472_18460 [Streptomyces sp. PTM05]|uniref:SpdD protein n=1 Tax=Streptantibioticus parmotrematis TaxID=2873249 RepID=A0ABS7QVY5_9ACTN|nr:hypothetical protein [Streptantibioticus parmotrematis]MBY8886834.1 hypothetical protein [Streptantibioticus parmotrematis]